MQTKAVTKTNFQVPIFEPRQSTQALELLELGNNRLWDIQVIGRAPMPEQPVRLAEWLIVPAHMDTTEVSQRAFNRVEAVFAAGIRPKGFVVVHEAPMALPAPPSEQKSYQWQLDSRTTQKVIDVLSLGIAGVGKVLTGALTAAVAVGSAVLPAFLVMSAIILDPILIAVTEDDYWIEIDRWWV